MSNRKFSIFVSLVFVLGAVIGCSLARMPHLQPYKLVNIIGLLFNLLAVFVLSEALISNPNWKKFCVEWIAPAVLWVMSIAPSEPDWRRGLLGC